MIFSDNVSNVSFQFDLKGSTPVPSVYFEGTNILVYIRGSDDDPNDWFLTDKKPKGKGGVLVNAHYDSVSIGFGATEYVHSGVISSIWQQNGVTCHLLEAESSFPLQSGLTP